MGERNPHQDRVINAHNQPRELLLPHISHGLVARVERLHAHAQWRLEDPVVHQSSHGYRAARCHPRRLSRTRETATRSRVSNQAAQTAFALQQVWKHRPVNVDGVGGSLNRAHFRSTGVHLVDVQAQSGKPFREEPKQQKRYQQCRDNFANCGSVKCFV
jgi:hypothetical protein